MATFSKKLMGKEVGQASVYAEPHTMSGGEVKDTRVDKSNLNTLNPSIGALTKDSNRPVKTSGIKIRGTGAATKGLMARGPIA
jgi:hypothetical protein